MSLVIKKPSSSQIYSFFISLSDTALYNFSIYPRANRKSVALRLSKALPKDKFQKIFGAFYMGKMVGYSFLKFSPKSTDKNICQFGIVIGESYQGKGYGDVLSKKTIDWAKNNKFKKIWLTVYSDNLGVFKLYKKIGFQTEGIFMYNWYSHGKFRHTISMALFFD